LSTATRHPLADRRDQRCDRRDEEGIRVAVPRAMPNTTPASVPSAAHFLLAALVTVAAGVHGTTPAFAQAGSRGLFTGIYLGADAGRVNVIGGSLVSGVDTLAQDSRAALTFFGGGRYEFPARIVADVE